MGLMHLVMPDPVPDRIRDRGPLFGHS